MAALKPYQKALLENRDVLLRDVRANDVCPLLYVSGVLTQKEIDDINIGRTAQERTESLLDLLHYKGPKGFQELCVALEDIHPHLAAKLRAKNPQIEVPGKPLSWMFWVRKRLKTFVPPYRTSSFANFGTNIFQKAIKLFLLSFIPRSLHGN